MWVLYGEGRELGREGGRERELGRDGGRDDSDVVLEGLAEGGALGRERGREGRRRDCISAEGQRARLPHIFCVLVGVSRGCEIIYFKWKRKC